MTLESPRLRGYAEAAWRRHAGSPAALESLADGSLPEAFHATARRVSERPALEVDGALATHGELDAAAAAVAGGLRADGVRPGDAVLLCAGNSLALVVAYLAVLRAGATVVLANPALTRHELGHLVADSGAVLALAGEASLASLPGVRAVPVERPPRSAPLAPEPADPGATAILAYTSGTTGTPKAVPLSHANLLSSIRAAMLAWRWTEHDRLVHGLPLFHQHGLGGVHATLLAGSRASVHGRFDADLICRAIAADRATVLFAVPAMYERLVEHMQAAAADVGSLRLVVSGSAPLSRALAERIERLFGQAPLERYGTTESGLDVSQPYDGPRRTGTVGLPLPGIELAIVRDGALVPDGETGEVVLRGPQVFSGYRGDAAATAAAFHPGGWFRTGDSGRIDPLDGSLELTGRLKDLIITGGMNVYPREVEIALEASPAVARAAVVGVPSERWGEEVVAAVVPATASLDADELGVFVRARLAPYKCPKRIAVVEELPTNAMGKVVASEVRGILEW